MIPAFASTGLLPPFFGDLTNSTSHSPYRSSMAEVVDRFATSAQRCAILEGLLNFRAALFNAGMLEGIQWLDGSFVEQRTPDHPNDVDVVTFFALLPPQEADFLRNHQHLITPSETKRLFKVDSYIVSLLQHPIKTVQETTFWCGLFGHQRSTSVWKGMVQVPLMNAATADDQARTLLSARTP